MRTYMRRLKRRQENKSRGAALVEFAIALPVFIALLLLVFDAGLGYSAARGSSQAARSGARIGALAGDAQDADFKVLDALRAHFDVPVDPSDDGGLQSVTIYRSPIGNTNGTPPPACLSSSVPAECNTYTAQQLFDLDPSQFFTTTLEDGTVTCDPSSLDAAWCPLTRRANEGDFLGVYINSIYDTTTGLEASAFNLEQRSVFALYFPPLPIEIVDGEEAP
jgi:Flp pilus assembly protein TadG